LRPQLVVSGITSLSDAILSIESGASSIGFIFYDDARKISMERAAEIVNQLPPFTSIMGEFLDTPVDKVKLHQRVCKLSSIRLCGTENADFIRRLNCRIIKLIRLKPDIEISKIKRNENCIYDFKLNFRMKNDGKRIMLYNRASQAMSKFPKSILSGGINPENISKVLNYSPSAVRINSGAEAFIGKKDKNKLNKIYGAIIEKN